MFFWLENLDWVYPAIKNAIDDAVVAAESMPDVLVRSASDVHKILNLVNVEISLYGDSNIENVKTTLPHHFSISWKKFGISKVHEIFFSAKCSHEIQWKMQSHDKDFTKATHTNSKCQIGLGNLIFCCTDSRQNYFGLVGWQNNNNNPKFQDYTSKNKNADYQVKETCAIRSIKVTYETNHIFLFRDSTMSNALNFCFLRISL